MVYSAISAGAEGGVMRPLARHIARTFHPARGFL